MRDLLPYVIKETLNLQFIDFGNNGHYISYIEDLLANSKNLTDVQEVIAPLLSPDDEMSGDDRPTITKSVKLHYVTCFQNFRTSLTDFFISRLADVCGSGFDLLRCYMLPKFKNLTQLHVVNTGRKREYGNRLAEFFSTLRLCTSLTRFVFESPAPLPELTDFFLSSTVVKEYCYGTEQSGEDNAVSTITNTPELLCQQDQNKTLSNLKSVYIAVPYLPSAYMKQITSCIPNHRLDTFILKMFRTDIYSWICHEDYAIILKFASCLSPIKFYKIQTRSGASIMVKEEPCITLDIDPQVQNTVKNKFWEFICVLQGNRNLNYCSYFDCSDCY